MSITNENPVGLKGIDYLEFACDDLTTPTATHFENLGFIQTAVKEAEDKVLYSQGQIRFLLNANKSHDDRSRQYFQIHKEGVSRMAFRVDNAEASLEAALSRGGEQVEDLTTVETEFGPIRKAAIRGFGDVLNEFVERPNEIFADGFTKIDNGKGNSLNTRASRIDHLTNNVPKGEMDHWVDFYKRVYGFVETRYFDIKGQKTGLQSKVVQSSDNNIIIPINEPEEENGKSQIQEFLDRHNGAGVQHIALMTPDIVSTVSQLRERGFKFLDVPSTYYEAIPERDFKVTEDLGVLEQNQILVDGDPEGYLLQIFTDTYIGPLFFEIIQRKNHWGFGEGNFQALFDAIERDQQKRGYL